MFLTCVRCFDRQRFGYMARSFLALYVTTQLGRICELKGLFSIRYRVGKFRYLCASIKYQKIILQQAKFVCVLEMVRRNFDIR